MTMAGLQHCHLAFRDLNRIVFSRINAVSQNMISQYAHRLQFPYPYQFNKVFLKLIVFRQHFKSGSLFLKKKKKSYISKNSQTTIFAWEIKSRVFIIVASNVATHNRVRLWYDSMQQQQQQHPQPSISTILSKYNNPHSDLVNLSAWCCRVISIFKPTGLSESFKPSFWDRSTTRRHVSWPGLPSRVQTSNTELKILISTQQKYLNIVMWFTHSLHLD